MSNQVPHAPVADLDTAPVETVGNYCCECGTFGAHETKCLCCGFDFRAGDASQDAAD